MELFIGLGIAIICVVIGLTLGPDRDQELENSRKAAWKALAKANHLNFAPAEGNPPDPEEYSVQGKYQGCNLVLAKAVKETGNIRTYYTQVSVQPRQRVVATITPDQFPLGQPLAYHKAKDLLREASYPYRPTISRLKIYYREQIFIYEDPDLDINNRSLEELFKALTTLANIYPTVVAIGGDAVPALQQIASDDLEPLQPVAQQFLRDISDDTTHRLHTPGKAFACANCLTYCASYELRLGWRNSLTFYGCRTCRQSREVLPDPLIAVLDNRVGTGDAKQQDNHRVNWLQRRELFDFSRVEIIQATDEEVERFAVQVGNDTDEWRKPRYKHIPCLVSAQCQLSENTPRILERMFPEVRVEAM